MWEKDEDHQKTNVGESVRLDKFTNDFLQDSPAPCTHWWHKHLFSQVSGLVPPEKPLTTAAEENHKEKVSPRGAHIFTDNQEHTVFFDFSLEKSH